jgi:hypothetical protein
MRDQWRTSVIASLAAASRIDGGFVKIAYFPTDRIIRADIDSYII